MLAGRPSMGKTALATNIAFNIAKAYARREAGRRQPSRSLDGGIVGFFSLEMSSEQLATRILSEQAEIASEKIRRGMITEDEFRRLVAGQPGDEPHPALHRPDRRHLDRPARRPRPQAQAPARPRPADRRLPAAAVRLLASSASDGRVQEITEITTGLKALAKELGVPDHRAVAAVAPGRAAARTSARSSPTCANRARSSRTPTS